MKASVKASVEASVEVTFVEAFTVAYVGVTSVEAFTEASVELTSVEASTIIFRGSYFHGSFHASMPWRFLSNLPRFHGSFHELPPKMQIVQVALLDVEISKYYDILQGVAQGCTPSPNLFKIYINDMIVKFTPTICDIFHLGHHLPIGMSQPLMPDASSDGCRQGSSFSSSRNVNS